MTKMEEIRSVLKQYFPELKRKYHLNYLGLFGSVTRDDFSANSDVDILVDFTQPPGLEFIDLAEDLERMLNCKVDLVSRNALKPNYYDQIKEDLTYV